MDSGDGGGGGGSSRGEPRRIVLVRRKPRTLTKLAIPSLLLALSLYNQWPGNRVYIAASPFLPFLRVPLSLFLFLPPSLSPSSYARWLCCSRYNPVHMYLLCVSMRFASVIPRSRRISPRRSVILANVKRDFRATIIAKQLRFPPNQRKCSLAFAIFHE